MRKKLFLFLVLIFVLGLLGYLSYNIATKTKEKKEIEQQLQILQKFEFTSLEDTSFTSSDINTNLNTILVFYNSGCDFCHHEAEGISEYKNQFTDTQILFISEEPLDSIRKFAQNYQLNKPPQIQFFHDTHHFFTNQLAVSSVPFLLIYDKDQQLIKKHQGSLNAPTLLNLLQQHE